MFQVRIHGRGGQGVVAAAEILSMASFDEGRHAQAFPSFGSERMGAPVVSYCRIDDRPIRTHEPIAEPDALIVQDATLVHQVDLFSGLTGEAYVLVNTSKSFEELGLADFAARFRPERLLTCPATALALEHVGRPAPQRRPPRGVRRPDRSGLARRRWSAPSASASPVRSARPTPQRPGRPTPTSRTRHGSSGTGG